MKHRCKKLLATLMSAAMLLSLLTVNAAAEDGTKSNPYLISTPAQLQAMNDAPSACYRLVCDIDMKYVDFTPVGNETVGAFTGSLDGAGHTIKNLTISLPAAKYAGLFGYLEGSVTDLTLSAADVNGGRYVGGLAAYAADTSQIADCTVGGRVYSGGGPISVNVGGAAGFCAGALTNVVNRADIITDRENGYNGVSYYVGGVAGCYAGEETLLRCTNSGSVTSSSNRYIFIGGIVGRGDGTVTITGCTNSGDVSGSSYAGGIVGWGDSTVTVRGCTNSGSISSDGAGGIVGYGDSPITVTGCTNSGSISGHSAGGIVGDGDGTVTVSDCTNNGSVSGSSYYVGGIVGRGDGTVTVTGCINSGEVSGSHYAGGIVGRGDSTITVTGCTNSGDVYGYNYSGAFYSDSSCYAGGIVGRGDGTVTVTGCTNSGSVSVSTDGCVAYAGGVVGYGRGGSRITQCCNVAKGNTAREGADDSTCVYWRYAPQQPGAAAKSLAELAGSDMAGWDYDTVWYRDSRYNSGLPMPRAAQPRLLLNEAVVMLAPGERRTLSAYYDGAVTTAVVYDSDNKEAATVSPGGIISAVGNGTACISAVMADGTRANCWVYVVTVSDTLTLQETARIDRGSSVTLTPQAAANANETYYWVSSNPDVVSVNNSGTVTGAAIGEAVITLTAYPSERTASCTVSVVMPDKVSSITLPASATVNIGTPYRLTPQMTPSPNSDTLHWVSSDETVVTVTDGLLTGAAPGMAQVTVTSGSGKNAACTVTVKQPARSIALDQATMTLEAGLTARLAAVITPADTTDAVTWSSSNTAIARVSSSGVVTGVGTGSAMITAATTSGQKAFCSVTVRPAAVLPTAIELSSPVLRMVISAKAQLTAAIVPSNATVQSVTWSSADETVAAVSDTGVVTALSAGETLIRATTANGIYNECTVKVSASSSASFVVSRTAAQPGAAVDVPVSIVRSDGVAAFTLGVSYDADALELTSVDAGSLLSAGTFTTNLETASPTDLRITWYAGADVCGSGEAFTLHFRVLDDAAGEYPVTLTYSPDDICNAEKETVPFGLENGCVYAIDYLSGDIYEDDAVNVKDIVYLARYFNQLETLSPRQRMIADIYGDGMVSTKDLVALQQQLTGGAQLLSANVEQMLYMPVMYAAPPQSLSPSTPFTVTAGSGRINASGALSVPVTASGCPGVAGYRIYLQYNADALRVTGVTQQESIPGTFVVNAEESADGNITVLWYGPEDVVLDGVLFDVEMETLPGAQAGSYPLDVSFAPDDISNAAYVSLPLTVNGGSVVLQVAACFTQVQCITTDDGRLCVSYQLQSNAAHGVSEYVAVAAYQGGRMVSFEMQPVLLDGETHRLETSVPQEYDTLKLFLLGAGDSLEPLAPWHALASQ